MDSIKEQVEQQRENQSSERLASSLGITPDELQQLEYDSSPISSGDIVTAYEYKFSQNSPQEILDKIKGLSPDKTIQLGIYDLEKPDA